MSEEYERLIKDLEVYCGKLRTIIDSLRISPTYLSRSDKEPNWHNLEKIFRGIVILGKKGERCSNQLKNLSGGEYPTPDLSEIQGLSRKTAKILQENKEFKEWEVEITATKVVGLEELMENIEELEENNYEVNSIKISLENLFKKFNGVVCSDGPITMSGILRHIGISSMDNKYVNFLSGRYREYVEEHHDLGIKCKRDPLGIDPNEYYSILQIER